MIKPICVMIENDQSDALYHSKQLNKLGWTAAIGFSVEEAQRLFCDRRPSNILMDLFLGTSESVLELPTVRSTWPGAPVTIMTETHSGTDHLDSLQRARAEGVDFVLKKPFSDGQLGEVLKDCESLTSDGTRRPHALIVDDSPVTLSIIADQLRQAGMRVSIANSMEAAFDPLSFDVVDVMVADIFMPGIGGIRGIEIVRSRWPTVGVVAMSGGFEGHMTASDTLTAADIVGADKCLSKPFDRDQVVDAVRFAATVRGDVSKLRPA